MKNIYGYLKLKSGKEINLEGQEFILNFNPDDIISIGEEYIGNEANIFLSKENKELCSIEEVKSYFKKNMCSQ